MTVGCKPTNCPCRAARLLSTFPSDLTTKPGDLRQFSHYFARMVNRYDHPSSQYLSQCRGDTRLSRLVRGSKLMFLYYSHTARYNAPRLVIPRTSLLYITPLYITRFFIPKVLPGCAAPLYVSLRFALTRALRARSVRRHLVR